MELLARTSVEDSIHRLKVIHSGNAFGPKTAFGHAFYRGG